MLSNDISVILPELLLAVYAMAALMFGVWSNKQEVASSLVLLVTALSFVGIGAWIGMAPVGMALPALPKL